MTVRPSGSGDGLTPTPEGSSPDPRGSCAAPRPRLETENVDNPLVARKERGVDRAARDGVSSKLAALLTRDDSRRTMPCLGT